MSKLLAVILLTITGLSANCQNWLTDFEQAKEIAKSKNHPIILVFQGSDWCSNCMMLDEHILSTETFVNHANENWVMLKADFPRSKKNKLSKEQQKKNDLLAEKYNQRGFFPFVVMLDYDGNVLGSTSYKKVSPESYIQTLSSFKKSK